VSLHLSFSFLKGLSQKGGEEEKEKERQKGSKEQGTANDKGN
jgi:hypothetical protein